MNGSNEERNIIIVVVPRTWRDIRVTFPQLLVMWAVGNYVGWCFSVIVFEENYQEDFWWNLAVTVITWLSLERAYKQSKFEQIMKRMSGGI